MTTNGQRYDLLLKGGTVIDPAAGRHGLYDVAVAGGKIAEVAEAIDPASADTVIDVAGRLVLPGMIDTHAHVYHHVTGRFGLEADLVGVRSGATTLVDQGGPSCMTLGGFRHFVAEQAESRVLAYISCYLVGGLEGHMYPELYGPGGVNVEHTAREAKANPDLIKGIKSHAEIGGASRWGLDVIRLGKEIGRMTGLPLYIHLGQLWPTKDSATVDADDVVSALVPLMEKGDILAHPFTRHPGGFVSAATGEVHPVVWEALERGVTVDVGHGSHFSFDMAKRVLDAGIRPFTLGADLHGYNVRIPAEGAEAAIRESNPFFGVAPFSLTIAMSELLGLGLKIDEVVAMVTCNPARMLGMEDELGSLQPGRVADVSVLDPLSGRFRLTDNAGDAEVVERILHPLFCLRAGRRHDANSPLVPDPAMLAA
jgi:dihydroorotase